MTEDNKQVLAAILAILLVLVPLGTAIFAYNYYTYKLANRRLDIIEKSVDTLQHKNVDQMVSALNNLFEIWKEPSEKGI